MTTYRVISIDVWGNERDGWVMNDFHYTSYRIEVKDDKGIIKALKSIGLLGKRFRFDVEFRGESLACVTRRKSGYPVYNLEEVES